MENALPGISSDLLEEADSSTTDTIEVVLGFIDGLPPETVAALNADEVMKDSISDMREFYSGLCKLRQRIMPTQGELAFILRPDEVFEMLIAGFDAGDPLEGAYPMPISLGADIVAPLRDAQARWNSRFPLDSHDIPLPDYDGIPDDDPPSPG